MRKWFVDYMHKPSIQIGLGAEYAGHITSTTVDDSGLMMLLSQAHCVDVLSHNAHALMLKLDKGEAVVWPDFGNGRYF